jgi:hypothetical protein
MSKLEDPFKAFKIQDLPMGGTTAKTLYGTNAQRIF